MCVVPLGVSINPAITARATVTRNADGVADGLTLVDDSGDMGIDDTYLFLTSDRRLSLHVSPSLVHPPGGDIDFGKQLRDGIRIRRAVVGSHILLGVDTLRR